MLSHANLLHNSAVIGYAFEHTRSSSGVFWLPSYHDMGLVGGILQPLYIGRPNILMPPMAFIQKPVRWLQAISRYRGTTSGGPNFAYDLCVRKVTAEERETLDLSSWTWGQRGGRAGGDPERFRYFAPCCFRRRSSPLYGWPRRRLVSGRHRPQRPRPGSMTGVWAPTASCEGPGADGGRTCGFGQASGSADGHRRSDRCPRGRTPGGGSLGLGWAERGAGTGRGENRTRVFYRASLRDTCEGPF